VTNQNIKCVKWNDLACRVRNEGEEAKQTQMDCTLMELTLEMAEDGVCCGDGRCGEGKKMGPGSVQRWAPGGWSCCSGTGPRQAQSTPKMEAEGDGLGQHAQESFTY
jgi:hypothetical protein